MLGSRTVRRFGFFVLFVISFLIRFFVGVQGVHGTDILAHVAGARSFLLTGSPYCLANYSYPPLYAVLQSLGILVFGWNVVGYKFVSMLFDSLLAILIAVFVSRFSGDYVLGFLSGFLWVSNPLAIAASSWYGLFDSIPGFLSMLSTYLLLVSSLTASAAILSRYCCQGISCYLSPRICGSL